MIVLDSQDPQDAKSSLAPVAGPTVRRPDRVFGGSTPSLVLPDYETSQAIELEALHLLRSPSSSANSIHRYKRASVRQWIPSRFWRIMFYVMILYVVLTLAIGVPLLVLKVFKRSAQNAMQISPLALSWLDDEPHDSPLYLENGVLVHSENATCDHWTLVDAPVSGNLSLTTAKYSLPATGSISMRLTTLYSNSLPELTAGGSLNVAFNSNPRQTQALFNVSLHTSSRSVRENVHVCFQQVGADRGVVIYIPTNLTIGDTLSLDIQLLLPRPSAGLKVTKLATYLPGIEQIFWRMDSYRFTQMNIEGAQASISFKSLMAQNMVVKNSLSPIIGTFNITRSLHLDNVGGTVNTNISMVHDSSNDSPTFVSIDSGNGDIRAKLLLSSPLKRSVLSNPQPNFTAYVKTFDAPINIDIDYDSSTPVAPLNMAVQNNLGASNITVDARYEGTFDMQTKLSQATVIEEQVDSWYDPAGLHRDFRYEYDHKSSNRIFGWVGWGSRLKPRMPGQSSLVASSSMSPVSLRFRERTITRTRR